MAKLEHYRETVQKALSDYAQMRFGSSSRPDLEIQTLFDCQHDHYYLAYVGWQNDSSASQSVRRVYSPLLHLDIKNEKIWLQLNTTEDDITEDLIKLGVPKEDIVLGFHPPQMRQFTDFAVG
ncbi:XisI protein [Myxacorys almedinensis]|uniref:XisI protein n=1 Tax=Myxacorys almedinensis A TaxID=2690445 RepID=A0A8J7YZC9_9CYAN|nr:XisI protein [Myxacorys almedinensis]NDJ16839.1 XisI protein [Myxacorys almedinensis A]